MFCQKFCMRCDAWVGTLLWWGCPSPFAHSCGLLNHPKSICRGMFKLNTNLMQIHCSTWSVILNVTATQYTCLLNTVYHPHWLVQWSRHCSCTCIPVHSPWLPGYNDVVRTVLIISIMAGLCPDRPHITYKIRVHRLLMLSVNLPANSRRFIVNLGGVNTGERCP